MIVFEHESGDKKFSCEEISSIILKHFKESAETYLETIVKNAVISVPAHFSDKQRQATMDAGVLAGFNVMRLINEPTSTTIAYGSFDTIISVPAHFSDKQRQATMDAGVLAGFNVMRLINEPTSTAIAYGSFDTTGDIRVKAVGGEMHLGGEDFDTEMVNYCVKVFEKKEKKVVTENAIAMTRLKFACEKAKRDLSSTTQTSIEIDSLYEGTDFLMKITRERFKDINACYFKKCIEHVEDYLTEGHMHKKDIDDVVIVGGSTWIPKVQQMLMDFFDGKNFAMALARMKRSFKVQQCWVPI
nr:putative heat shock protein 70 family, peptide-binding domain protein [Tanacetum cinerariifolium]